MYEIDKSDGWVKNWRRIKHSPWYQNPFTAHLAQHLIREVSHKPAKVFFSGSVIELSIGQTVTTLRKLSKQTGIPLQRLRSSIAVLEKCQFLTHQSTQCYSIISILKYDIYQDKATNSNTEINTGATQYQHSAIYNDLQEAKNTRNGLIAVSVVNTPISQSAHTMPGSEQKTACKNSGSKKRQASSEARKQVEASNSVNVDQVINRYKDALSDQSVAGDIAYQLSIASDCQHTDVGVLWAYIVQCRGKINPSGWLRSVLINAKSHRPSDAAFTQSQAERRQYEHHRKIGNIKGVIHGMGFQVGKE